MPQITFKIISNGKKAISKIACPKPNNAQKGTVKIAYIINKIIILITISQMNSNVILSCFFISSTTLLVKLDSFLAPFLIVFSKS